MSRDLLDLVRELNTLNDDNLADRVIANSDVQWCLSELQDILEEMPTLTPPNEWVSVEVRLPELPDEARCWVLVLGCRQNSKYGVPMFYERAVIRGKTVERWKNMWDRIETKLPDYWMPLPAPPDRRPPEREADA